MLPAEQPEFPKLSLQLMNCCGLSWKAGTWLVIAMRLSMVSTAAKTQEASQLSGALSLLTLSFLTQSMNSGTSASCIGWNGPRKGGWTGVKSDGDLSALGPSFNEQPFSESFDFSTRSWFALKLLYLVSFSFGE